MARSWRLPAWALGLTLLADLATKWLVQQRFQLGESLPLCPGLALTYVMNPGAAFSLFANGSAASLRLPLFFGVTLAALVRHCLLLPQPSRKRPPERAGPGPGGRRGRGQFGRTGPAMARSSISSKSACAA